MHSLRWKQRVSDVQARVFRRRHTSDVPPSSAGQLARKSDEASIFGKISIRSSASSSKASKKSEPSRKGQKENGAVRNDLEVEAGNSGLRHGVGTNNGNIIVDAHEDHPAATKPTSPLPSRPTPPTPPHSPSPEHPLLTPQSPAESPRPVQTVHGRPLSPVATPTSPSYPTRPAQIIRRQSLLPATETNLIQSLLGSENKTSLPEGEVVSDFRPEIVEFPLHTTVQSTMVNRKLWVKRPGGSSTTVTVNDDDLVDDVREVILRKYQNALGRSYDAPDIQLRVMPRGGTRPRSLDHRGHGHGHHGPNERLLNPDEVIMRTMDEYYPGGQSADEALIIDVPQRRTPRPSPSHVQSYTYGAEHHHEGNDYFSAVPLSTGHSQGTPQATLAQPSMSVLTTGQVPPLPGSPGGRRGHRPAMRPRMNTSSPTLHGASAGGGAVVLVPRQSRSRVNSDASNHIPPPPPPPTAPDPENSNQKVPTPPPIRVNSPPTKPFKKEKKQAAQSTQPPAGSGPDGAVPPIKVLIVEDNVINLRLLEAFMRRLKVRWESAMNGKIAVDKWKAGGFHLILMDIQLPVMNGLDATREIRRLERVNSIGSFPHTKLLEEKAEGEDTPEELKEQDKLPDSILFRSPVIIVALTASSLQSDRHEAYEAGCNDFLTKPVNFIWLEKKVTEWGCMQALIDFDGWRKWKIIASEQSNSPNDKNKGPKSKRQRMLKESASPIAAAG